MGVAEHRKEKVHTVFCSGCTILHEHPPCTTVLISPHPQQHIITIIIIIIIAIIM